MKSRCLNDLKRKKPEEKKHANKVGISTSLSFYLVKVCIEKATESMDLFFFSYFITKRENEEGKKEGMRLAERGKRRTSSIDAEGRRRREEREYRVGIMNQKRNPSTTAQSNEVTFWSYLCFVFFFVYTNHIDTKEIHISHMLHSLLTDKEKRKQSGTVIREERVGQRETTVGLVHLRCCVVNQCHTERRIS